jgi:hypothetical protein
LDLHWKLIPKQRTWVQFQLAPCSKIEFLPPLSTRRACLVGCSRLSQIHL